MNMEQMRQAKERYDSVEIPGELEQRVEGAIHAHRAKEKNRGRVMVLRGLAGLAAVLGLCIVPLNTVDGLAASLGEIPVVGSIARALTFRTFSRSSGEQQYGVEIDVPMVEGLEDQALADSINSAYLAESEALYQGFLEEIGGLREGQLANRALESGYEVVPSREFLLVIRRYVLEIAGSSAERVSYLTLDTELERVVTLPGLFAGEGYQAVIDEEILRQMRERMDADPGQIYFLPPEEGEAEGAVFQGIAPDQTFYISRSGKLVIVFDEYEAAPGYMGVVEFEIPTELLHDLLAGDRYLS